MKKEPLDRVSKAIREAEFKGFASQTRENCRVILQEPTARDYIARVDKLFGQIKILEDRGVFSRESAEIDIDEVMTQKSAAQLQQVFAEITMANGAILITDPNIRTASMRIRQLQRQINMLDEMGAFSSENKPTNPIMSENQISELETTLEIVHKTYGLPMVIPSRTNLERVETPPSQAAFDILDNYLKEDSEEATQLSLDELSKDTTYSQPSTGFLVKLDESHLSTVRQEIADLEKRVEKNQQTIDEARATKDYLKQETTLSDEAKIEINQSLDDASAEARDSIEKTRGKLTSLKSQHDRLANEIEPKREVAAKEATLIQQLEEHQKKPDLISKLKSAKTELEKMTTELNGNKKIEINIPVLLKASIYAANKVGADLKQEGKKLEQWEKRKRHRGRFSRKTSSYKKADEKVRHYQVKISSITDQLAETRRLVDLLKETQFLESRIDRIPGINQLESSVAIHKHELEKIMPASIKAFENKVSKALASDTELSKKTKDNINTESLVETAYAIIDENELVERASAIKKKPVLQNELAEVNREIKHAEDNIRSYTELQNRIDQSTIDKNVSLEKDISQLSAALQATHKKLDQWQQALPNTQKKIIETKHEISELIEKIGDIDRQLNLLTNQRPSQNTANLDGRRAKLAGNLATARSNLSNFEQSSKIETQANRKVSHYEAEAKKIQQKINQLTQQLHDNKKSLEPGKGDFAELIAPHQNSLVRAQQRAAIIKKELASLPNEEILQKTIDVHQRQLAKEDSKQLRAFQSLLELSRDESGNTEKPLSSKRKARPKLKDITNQQQRTTPPKIPEKPKGITLDIKNKRIIKNEKSTTPENKNKESVSDRKKQSSESQIDSTHQQVDKLLSDRKKILTQISLKNSDKNLNNKFNSESSTDQLEINLNKVENTIDKKKEILEKSKESHPKWAKTKPTTEQEKELKRQEEGEKPEIKNIDDISKKNTRI